MTQERIDAEKMMAEAKERFTRAAKAALAGDEDAPRLVRLAYADVQRARSALQALSSHGRQGGA